MSRVLTTRPCYLLPHLVVTLFWATKTSESNGLFLKKCFRECIFISFLTILMSSCARHHYGTSNCAWFFRASRLRLQRFHYLATTASKYHGKTETAQLLVLGEGEARQAPVWYDEVKFLPTLQRKSASQWRTRTHAFAVILTRVTVMIRVVSSPVRKHHGTGRSPWWRFDWQGLSRGVSRHGASGREVSAKLAGFVVAVLAQKTTKGKLRDFVIRWPCHSLLLASRGDGGGL